MNFFDSRFETVHLERRQSFGIPRWPTSAWPKQPSWLASSPQSSRCCWSLCKTVSRGAVCTLYGSKFAFSIVVECAPLPPVVVLSMVALDDFIPALPVVQGRVDDYRSLASNRRYFSD
jgi:hypothetical protein